MAAICLSSGAPAGSSDDISRTMSKIYDIPEKVLKYEAFLNDVLRAQLKRLVDERATIAEEIADYRRLQAATAAFRRCQEPVKTRVDVGCGFLMNTVLFPADQQRYHRISGFLFNDTINFISCSSRFRERS